ncbi:Metal-dependent hydrolases of the beta-lactamase superfamily I [Salinisphaera sp. PC39]|uniref:hypothetical protein n=1 Tax=Salinisphaera sp. PC39 TaxID=1304156 RepID=UPI0033414045
MRYIIQLAAALIAALALAACNDSSSGDDSSGSAGASPSLGLITNAAVNFYEADGTTLIGSAETGDDGSVDIQTGSYDGPVVVEVLGDDTDAMYYDEASATLVPFPDGSAIHAIVSGPGTVGVTPLTEIAYLAAQRQGLFPISAQAVDELNEIVRAALAPGLSSILSVPTLVGDPGVTSLGDDEAGNYALLLAALAELGSGQAAPALAVLDALAADLADGDIDGEDNGTDIGAPYADFLAEMQTALNDIAGDYSYPGTPDDQRPVSSVVDTSGVSNPDDGDGDGNSGNLVCNSTSATLNTDLVGTYDLVYTESETGGPFNDGEGVQATVSSSGQLHIGGTILADPQHCIYDGSTHTPEIIWADPDEQIEYALTDNDTGTFNEINVGDASRPRDFGDTQLPTFLGQLKPGTNGGPPQQLLDIAGNYNPYVVIKGGDFRSAYALEQQVPVSIDPQTGVITVDSQYTLDPADEDFYFEDRSGDATPRYSVRTKDDQDRTLELWLYIEDGSVIAHRFILRDDSPGSDVIEAEERPLPTEITDLFAAFHAGDQPFELVTVLDDESYNSGFDSECTTFDVTTSDGTQKSTADTLTPFVAEISSDTFIYEHDFYRADTRYSSDSGDQSLTFTELGKRFTLRADGYVDVTAFFTGDLKDRATNDPSEISAAGCDTPASGIDGSGDGDPTATAVGSGEGATGDVNGDTRTFTNTLAKPGAGNNYLVGAEGDLNGQTWEVTVPPQSGTYRCNETADTYLVHRYNDPERGISQQWYVAHDPGGACEIVAVRDGDLFEGTFSATLIDRNGSGDGTVTNGGFRVTLPESAPPPVDGGGSGGVLGDANGASGTIDGTTETVTDDVFTTEGSGLIQITARDSDRARIWDLQLPASLGQHNCQPGAGGTFVKYTRDTGFNAAATGSNATNTCTIEVTAIDADSIQGTFTGTLVDQNDNPFPVNDGEFAADR